MANIENRGVEEYPSGNIAQMEEDVKKEAGMQDVGLPEQLVPQVPEENNINHQEELTVDVEKEQAKPEAPVAPSPEASSTEGSAVDKIKQEAVDRINKEIKSLEGSNPANSDIQEKVQSLTKELSTILLKGTSIEAIKGVEKEFAEARVKKENPPEAVVNAPEEPIKIDDSIQELKRKREEIKRLEKATQEMSQEGIREGRGGVLPPGLDASGIESNIAGFNKKKAELLEAQTKVEKIVKTDLSEAVKELNGAVERKDANSEKAAIERAGKSYEAVTENSLKEKAKEKALAEAEKIIGKKQEIITPDEFKRRHLESEKNKVKADKISGIIQRRLGNLSEEERVKFQSSIDVKLAELSSKGVQMSQDAFWSLMDTGIQPETIKINGWFRSLYRGKIEFVSNGKRANYSEEKFAALIAEGQSSFEKSVDSDAGERVEREIQRRQAEWKNLKKKNTVGILSSIAEIIAEEQRQEEKKILEQQIEEEDKKKQKEKAAKPTRKNKNREKEPKAKKKKVGGGGATKSQGNKRVNKVIKGKTPKKIEALKVKRKSKPARGKNK